jgi:hypothetical protein
MSWTYVMSAALAVGAGTAVAASPGASVFACSPGRPGASTGKINKEGAFYRGNSASQQRIPSIGHYQPNTRQTRVTLLLHELGHLVRGADKHWLLSDDGHDGELSEKNTKYILDVCRDDIEAVTRMTVAQQLEEPLTTIAQLATLQ